MGAGLEEVRGTVGRELTSLKSQHKDLSERLGRDLTILRSQQLNAKSAKITEKGNGTFIYIK